MCACGSSTYFAVQFVFSFFLVPHKLAFLLSLQSFVDTVTVVPGLEPSLFARLHNIITYASTCVLLCVVYLFTKFHTYTAPAYIHSTCMYANIRHTHSCEWILPCSRGQPYLMCLYMFVFVYVHSMHVCLYNRMLYMHRCHL